MSEVGITVSYDDTTDVWFDPEDVADDLSLDADERTIRASIRASIDAAVSDQPHPAYTVGEYGLRDLITKVQKCLAERRGA